MRQAELHAAVGGGTLLGICGFPAIKESRDEDAFLIMHTQVPKFSPVSWLEVNETMVR